MSPVKPSGVPPPSAAKIKAIDMIMQEEEKERALARELERNAERTANAFQAKRQAEELLNAEAEKSIPSMPAPGPVKTGPTSVDKFGFLIQVTTEDDSVEEKQPPSSGSDDKGKRRQSSKGFSR